MTDFSTHTDVDLQQIAITPPGNLRFIAEAQVEREKRRR